MPIQDIIILHGWKLSGAKYGELKNTLTKFGYNVYTPDLPGFGKDASLNKVFSMKDYVLFLDDYLKKIKTRNCALIGHSLGGRIVIAYFYENRNDTKSLENIKAVILSGVPVFRSDSSPRKVIGKFLLRGGKKIIAVVPVLSYHENMLRKFLYRFIGEWDYYNSGNLRRTFINVIHYSLEDKLRCITVPALLLWGKNDRVTPYKDAVKLCGKMRNAKLAAIENGTHKIPYERSASFAEHVKGYLSSL